MGEYDTRHGGFKVNKRGEFENAFSELKLALATHRVALDLLHDLFFCLCAQVRDAGFPKRAVLKLHKSLISYRPWRSVCVNKTDSKVRLILRIHTEVVEVQANVNVSLLHLDVETRQGVGELG